MADKREGKPRSLRSLKDVKRLIDMHPERTGYRARLVALHGINTSATIQRMLQAQIKRFSWQVEGIQHLAGVVELHRLIGRSAGLLDRVIRGVLQLPGATDLLQEGTPSDEDEDYVTALPPAAKAIDPRTPSGDDEDEEDVTALAPAAKAKATELARFPIDIREERIAKAPLRVCIAKAPLRVPINFAALPHVPGAIEDEDLAALPRVAGAIEDEDLTALPHVAGAIEDEDLAALPHVHGATEDEDLPALHHVPGATEDEDLDELSPDVRRFDGPLTVALPGPRDKRRPKLYPDEEQESGFQGQVLLLPYPHPHTVDDYAAKTLLLSERMLEAGTSVGEQPLLRAPGLVGLAAMVLSGHSPPRPFDRFPDLHHLIRDLVESGQALRRHQTGSAALDMLVVDLGGRLELVATDILTARQPLPELVKLLQLVKENLHLLWQLRIPALEFKKMGSR